MFVLNKYEYIKMYFVLWNYDLCVTSYTIDPCDICIYTITPDYNNEIYNNVKEFFPHKLVSVETINDLIDYSSKQESTVGDYVDMNDDYMLL